MGTYNLKGKYETLLSSLSNDISASTGKRVSKREILERILDVVIKEERLFSSEEQPVSFFKRAIFKAPDKKLKDTGDLLAQVRCLNKD